MNGDRTYFTNDDTPNGKKYSENVICQMLDFLIDNIYIKVGSNLFRQCIGIPMGTNCAPLLANLFLYSYEVEFLTSLRTANKRLAKSFNFTSRYIDDLININNSRFRDFLKEIYPEELVIKETSKPRRPVEYLDLNLDVSSGDLVCSIFDKRDYFNFHIVNFPYLSGNIPSAPAYGTYISQLIRYGRACHRYEDFASQHSALAERLVNQGFLPRKLMRTFYKFMGRYPDLISKYDKGPSSIICDSIPMAQLFYTFPEMMK